MKRTLILAAAGVASTVLAVAPASAQFGRWTDRGWRTVAYTRVDGRDTDTIRMRGHIRERAIRVCAINAPLNLRDFDIRFENGGHQDVRVRQRIGAGTCTRNIDLAGNRRDIETVRLRYSPIRRGWTRPLIRVQAR